MNGKPKYTSLLWVILLTLGLLLGMSSGLSAAEVGPTQEIPAFTAQIWNNGQDEVITCDSLGNCDFQSEGQNPEFSPDGLHLIYNTWDSTDIPMVMAKSLSNGQAVTVTPGIQPVFCEDGQTVVYAGFVDGGPSQTLYSVTVNLETGSVTSPTQLISIAGNERHPSCGNGVVFYEKPGNGWYGSTVWQLNLATLETTEVDMPIYGAVGMPSVTRWSTRTEILHAWNYQNYDWYVSGLYNLDTQEHQLVAGDPFSWTNQFTQPNCGWNETLCLVLRLRQYDGDVDEAWALDQQGNTWKIAEAPYLPFDEYRHLSPHPNFHSAPPMTPALSVEPSVISETLFDDWSYYAMITNNTESDVYYQTTLSPTSGCLWGFESNGVIAPGYGATRWLTAISDCLGESYEGVWTIAQTTPPDTMLVITPVVEVSVRFSAPRLNFLSFPTTWVAEYGSWAYTPAVGPAELGPFEEITTSVLQPFMHWDGSTLWANPTHTDGGDWPVVLTATTLKGGLVATQEFTLHVELLPEWWSPPYGLPKAWVGEFYTATLTARDVDGHLSGASFKNLPAWLEASPLDASGVLTLTGMPPVGIGTSSWISFTGAVSDTYGLTAVRNFYIEVGKHSYLYLPLTLQNFPATVPGGGNANP